MFGRREVLGLRQDELADLADCSPRFVTELEQGKPTVQLDKVIAVLAALGLHLDVVEGAQDRVTASAALRAELSLARSEDDG